ncbi:DUF692 domain-containing protein [Streptomyces sp. PTM05]|uniref:DUF692 domain-containing protein n=1 Tax=Streptantibioticus parmotrematis TaxID=2873249 RepID=A0ABS7QLD8_9ACTN|nr:DUF692 domain-containing protein [Streptantibioticus parmotrematis]MBY8884015.1 DUF692 domain-containing protein [Streptantibioticus parmotrematis]
MTLDVVTTDGLTRRIARRGAGVGYRRELHEDLATHAGQIDVVEILADQWRMPGGLDTVREVCGRFRAVPHGVGLSLAGAGRIDPDYLVFIKELSGICEADYYSEHLAMTHVPGVNSGHLCPPILSEESLRRCVRNVLETQSAIGMPLAIENITYNVTLGSHLDAASFLAELVDRTDALLLLDVANLYINSVNFSFDVDEYLDQLPLERVVHIHLAGGVTRSDGTLMDTHSEIIGDSVWQLAEKVSRRCAPSTVIIEHDSNFPEFRRLVDEVGDARGIFFADTDDGRPVGRACAI